jgi:acyl-CoA synthetase (AMP-forming)/AMP-acid ligase II
VEFNVGDVHEAIASDRGDNLALAHRHVRRSWCEIAQRSRQLANSLHNAGLGCHRERDELAPWESGQDHLALFLHNGPEYLEAMLGAFKARVAPFNVNYRYSASELRPLLVNADTAAVIVHSALIPVLSLVLRDMARAPLILQVPDYSNRPLMHGARWYDDFVAAGADCEPPVRRSPDDLYVLFTGGTTGSPKGVLWRQGDAFVGCFGGSPTAQSMEQVVAEATTSMRMLVAAPLMHGAGQWAAFGAWHSGGAVYLAPGADSVYATDVLSTIEGERIGSLLIVGDAFAKPLVDELDRRTYDMSSLTSIVSGGAALSERVKNDLLSRLPTVLIADGVGSSEAGGQLMQVCTANSVRPNTFRAAPGTVLLSDQLDAVLDRRDRDLGWVATTGPVALGYLGDRAATQAAYPTVDGVRYAVPGDRAHMSGSDFVMFRGRDGSTINTGGEKVFAEEVEAALKHDGAVYDCVVTGSPSDVWGTEVVAIVALTPGSERTAGALRSAAAMHLARYKLPKRFVFVTQIQRLATGKPDYHWARSVTDPAELAVGERP